MHRVAVLVLLLATGLTATDAAAFGLRVTSVESTGASTSVLEQGDRLTFDIVVDNATGIELYGVAVEVLDYDEPDVTFTRDYGLALAGGLSATHLFTSPGDPEGIENVLGSVPQEFYVAGHLSPRAFTTSAFEGIRLEAASGDGSNDIGIHGGRVGDGDVHFRVTFAAVPAPDGLPQTTDMSFEMLGVIEGGEVVYAEPWRHRVTVIPEPGTALLIGLGLGVLARTRGSRR